MKIQSAMDVYFSKDFGEFLDGGRSCELGYNNFCWC